MIQDASPSPQEAFLSLLLVRPVVDTGQITGPLRRWLNRKVKAGRIVRQIDYSLFPLPRLIYWLPHT